MVRTKFTGEDVVLISGYIGLENFIALEHAERCHEPQEAFEVWIRFFDLVLPRWPRPRGIVRKLARWAVRMSYG